MATKLMPVRDIPSYAVIIRCIHERGETQREALEELGRRRLWLSGGQKQQAGLPYGEWCRDPVLCAGKGYCPRDPTCGD